MISCLEGTSGSETSEGEEDMFVLDSEDEVDQDLSNEEGMNLADIIENIASYQANTDYYWVSVSLPLLLSLFYINKGWSLGRYNRVVIPRCVVNKKRQIFPKKTAVDLLY